MFAFNQSGGLQQTFQNHFAPVALHFGVSFQGTGQVVGIFAEAVVQLHQFLDAFTQREAFFGFGAVYLFHLLAEVLQVIAQRTEQIAQVFGIQPGKVFGFALEDTVGEILELGVHALVQRFGFFLLQLQ